VNIARIAIARAIPADAAAILALQRLAYESEARLYDDWSLPPLLQSMESLEIEIENSVVLKMIDGDEIVGSVRASVDGETCRIGRLIVTPRLQGVGLGSRLMHAIEREFTQTRRFELFTGSRSERNILLYERLGYRRVREQVLSPAVTLIYMEKIR
jgi:ribosomal protein S18 acetylase RimI-like enzyme